MAGDVDRTSPWLRLRAHTPARIGLARTGIAIATDARLDFQLAHAQARDAVQYPLAPDVIGAGLKPLGLEVRFLRSAATDRRAYLLHPGLGRRLDAASAAELRAPSPPPDVVFVIADGLSARAPERHAAPLLAQVLPLLAQADWRIGPASVVTFGRVAVGDEIGAALGARLVAVLIGERPGLSSPDSLGVYVTWNPRPGCKDADRNCISNIRPEGLGYAAAAAKLVFLLTEARRRGVTGVALKDETGAALLGQ